MDRLARAEYLVMRYAIELATQLRVLVSPDLELIVNEAGHGLERDELESLLQQMFSTKTLVAHTRTRGYFTPSAKEIAAALDEPKGELPDIDPRLQTYYTVTTPSLERFRELERLYSDEDE
ncbi:MAG: hypothetical protein MJE77_25845 [Proteobacteria bacterium]|nr:hypothetical protein [Pseudomonadota bacterium]